VQIKVKKVIATVRYERQKKKLEGQSPGSARGTAAVNAAAAAAALALAPGKASSPAKAKMGGVI
jgi:hypothetical protein